MFPVGDTDLRNQPFPVLTVGLAIVNILVFIYQLTLPQEELIAFITRYGAVPAEILQGQNIISLLTSMFVHGGWVHIISNMVYLWIFGDNIEAVLGKLGFAVFYLLGGVGASAAHVLINAGTTQPSVGASGAIAAIMGAYIVMFPRSQVRVALLTFFGLMITRVTAFVFLGVWALSQFFVGVASLGAETAQSGGVAIWAHIGGFVFGLLVGFLFRSKAQELDLERRRRRRRA
jgi:membrane associated rhomboid family serine protease